MAGRDLRDRIRPVVWVALEVITAVGSAETVRAAVLAVADPAALEAEDREAEVVQAVLAADVRAEEAQAEDERMPQAIRSSKEITSARIKPRSKSEWILPAACGAFVPFVIVHARTSGLPAVR